MKLTWYGTASIMLETAESIIAFDPFMKRLPQGAEPQSLADERKAAFLSADKVIITHGHLDHLASVYELYNDRSCNVYASKTPLNTLRAQGFAAERLHLAQPGSILEFSDLSVLVHQGKHVKYDLGVLLQILGRISSKEDFRQLRQLSWLNGLYPENGETLFFEIIAEGKRMQLMGSAELAVDADYPTGADVLILPHQGRSDIDRHNMRIVHRLKPKRVLVDHYDDSFPPISSRVPAEAFCCEIGIPAEMMSEGESIFI